MQFRPVFSPHLADPNLFFFWFLEPFCAKQTTEKFYFTQKNLTY